MEKLVNISPLITVALPSMNQGRFLEQALTSIFSQGVPVEVMLADGGSTDNTCEIIEKWQDKLTWWRSAPDAGQAAAINEAIAHGTAPFVCWMNSDDIYLDGGLQRLLNYMRSHPEVPAVYGRSWNADEKGKPTKPYWTGNFSEWRLRQQCFISQPATLIRRDVWEAVHGLDENIHLAMDYDLWWKILRRYGPLAFLQEFIAINRVHGQTKTSSQRHRHYAEAMAVVRRHAGYIPFKWYLAWPWSVWLKSKMNKQRV